MSDITLTSFWNQKRLEVVSDIRRVFVSADHIKYLDSN
jgi:hypothetical protein